MQNKLRDGCARAAFVTGLSAAGTFTLAILVTKGAPDAAYGALLGLWLLVVVLSIVAFAFAAVRQVVAHSNPLEVDGERIAWRDTTAPKLGFLRTLGGISRPAWAWVVDFSRAIRPHRYARLQSGYRHQVFVDPDLFEVFGSAEAINEALRMLAEIFARNRRGKRRRAA